ncbi:hypothetical protein AB0368_06740 [Actinoplanes sp. NPDC051475]|uniref:hypothetical protein n=1 Tax=Actinoplanes sp. NPDC051475 TaxID=3157225 RepID=UPI00344E2F1B
MTAVLTRLWWRLEDVLPLAEHAMVCPTQARTGVRQRAHALEAPALTWSTTGGPDLLTSTGVPSWRRPDGTEHHAEAHTWRHRTGRYGTAWRDTYHHAHLPLLASDGHRSVLERLRDARDSGRQHWVTIDIDPADDHLIAADRVKTAGHRDQLAPDGARWHLDAVTSPTVGGVAYPAWVAAAYRTADGAVLARFDQTTTARMIDDLSRLHHHPGARPGEYPLLRVDAETLVVLEEYEAGRTVAYREIERIVPDDEGRYAIGAYLWPWQIAESRHYRRWPWTAALRRRRQAAPRHQGPARAVEPSRVQRA